jgi:Mg2+ and Co2+ transporter CorA
MAKDKCPSAETVKQLEKAQATLDFNQQKFMEVLEKIEKKVDSIYKHIFE